MAKPGGESKKVVYVAIVANLVIAIAKFTAAAFTGSSAMLAEGFHSSVDTINELLLLIGLRRSAQPPDRSHPFGHGKELFFWSMIVAVSMFGIGGGMSIYEGVSGMLHPEGLQDAIWAYSVLGVAAVFEGYSWNIGRKALSRNRRTGESLWSVVRRSTNPALFSPFVEDTAALAGIAVAFLGVWLSHVFTSPYLDSAASIVIGIIMVGSALVLAREVGALVVGESVDPRRMDEIRHAIEAHSSVERVGNVLTMQMGAEQVLLNADVRFRRELNTAQLETAVDEIESAVRDKVPEVKRIFFEAEGLTGREPTQAA